MQGATTQVNSVPAAAPAGKKPRKAMPKGDEEMLAMGRIDRLLGTLTPLAACRVLEWAVGRQRQRQEQKYAGELLGARESFAATTRPSPAERAAVSAPLDNGKY